MGILVAAGLIPTATLTTKGVTTSTGMVNFSYYNKSPEKKYYKVISLEGVGSKTISLLCNMKFVLDTEQLFLICARTHSNDNQKLFVQKYAIVGPFPTLYIDYSNKKIYIKVNSYTHVSFLILCGEAECFTFNDKITIDSVEGLEML